MLSRQTAMATRKEKKAASEGGDQTADDAAREEGSEASLAVRESSDLEEGSDEAGEEQDDDQDELAAEGSEEAVARQLGADRYVMAGFFALAIMGGFVLGKSVQTLWSDLSSRDWFSRAVPTLAAVSDESRTTYAMVLGGIASLVITLRVYRRPDVRAWTDDVASELMKVKWPTKKEVTNSTLVVIAASAFATFYLALLDRLWSFVTGIVYGTGS